MDLGLAGKRCVVTGASRGIGRRTAELLAGEGASVLLVARSEDALAEVAAGCDGGRAFHLACDVTGPGAAERIATAASESLGGADVLVNNAGAAQWRALEEVPEGDWQDAWELNVMAPLRISRALIPGMAERGWGRIVNVSSTAGKRPSTYLPEYSVAKAAQLSLSRLLADTYAGTGILVNAVCPGPTASEMWLDEGGLLDQARALGGHPDRETARQAVGASRPLGRLAEVAEIAAAIVFLCSEQASYVTGAAWSVDGGTVPVII